MKFIEERLKLLSSWFIRHCIKFINNRMFNRKSNFQSTINCWKIGIPRCWWTGLDSAICCISQVFNYYRTQKAKSSGLQSDLSIKVLSLERRLSIIISDVEEYCGGNNSKRYCCQQQKENCCVILVHDALYLLKFNTCIFSSVAIESFEKSKRITVSIFFLLMIDNIW